MGFFQSLFAEECEHIYKNIEEVDLNAISSRLFAGKMIKEKKMAVKSECIHCGTFQWTESWYKIKK